ncbi:hypothetical protein L596_019699 [Steinernema carpocapsae]|uniref:Uncharacterized protein n=1 Tax=Steinernema carpocapsae TaxID=34508 RepID=A0A4U5MRB4_STECR|nr:hypothetical protein L596_019699 [Steinernema carpocapsae]
MSLQPGSKRVYIVNLYLLPGSVPARAALSLQPIETNEPAPPALGASRGESAAANDAAHNCHADGPMSGLAPFDDLSHHLPLLICQQ